MSRIKKLDTQLANQIAAGEVVERPASVVKELLENSLDAKATRIDIDIEAGGMRLIRIKDNGIGIAKDDLELALAPYATSKIAELNDLSAIASYGFRGEALASISSVSQFSLSSRPKDQGKGWQAVAEGREMQVKLSPAAVAEGTLIQVRELFFNTPARRRFLRTEKTEFSHIEEVVKKAALANFNVAINLKHNGRTIKKLRAASNQLQKEQRIAAVIERNFMLNAIHLDMHHEGIGLSGWLGLPSYHRSQNDGQFFYVNQRPVKDKVLNHAIRQAYQQFIPEGRVPAYVLYLTLDPKEVDVNVHPTKHEVRFHNNRLVHDLIQQAIMQALSEQPIALNDSSDLTVQAPQGQGTLAQPQTQPWATHQAKHGTADSHQLYSQMLSQTNLAMPMTDYVAADSWRCLTRVADGQVLIERLPTLEQPRADQRVAQKAFKLLSLKPLVIEQLRGLKLTSEPQRLLFPIKLIVSESLSEWLQQLFSALSYTIELTQLPEQNPTQQQVQLQLVTASAAFEQAESFNWLLESLLLVLNQQLTTQQLSQELPNELPEELMTFIQAQEKLTHNQRQQLITEISELLPTSHIQALLNDNLASCQTSETVSAEQLMAVFK